MNRVVMLTIAIYLRKIAGFFLILAWVTSCSAEPPAASLAGDATAGQVDCAGVPIKRANVIRDNIIDHKDLSAVICHMGQPIDVDASLYSANHHVEFLKITPMGTTLDNSSEEEISAEEIQIETHRLLRFSVKTTNYFYDGVYLHYPAGGTYRRDDGVSNYYSVSYVGGTPRFTFEDFNRQVNPNGWKHVNPEGWSVEMLESIYYENFPNDIKVDEQLPSVLDADGNQVDGAILSFVYAHTDGTLFSDKTYVFMFAPGAEDMNISKLALYNVGGERVYEHEVEVIASEGGNFDLHAETAGGTEIVYLPDAYKSKGGTVDHTRTYTHLREPDQTVTAFYLVPKDVLVQRFPPQWKEFPPTSGGYGLQYVGLLDGDVVALSKVGVFLHDVWRDSTNVAYKFRTDYLGLDRNSVLHRHDSLRPGCKIGETFIAMVYKDPIVYQGECKDVVTPTKSKIKKNPYLQ